jgi:CheY-like chemotaxis protein
MGKILIVDDERVNLLLEDKILSNAGYSVIKAENGKEALVMAKAQKPDLIILDVMMPNMDGGEVITALEKDPDTKDIPVVFLTSLITKGEEKKKNVIAGRFFVAKPCDPKELLDTVEKHIGKGK